MKLINKFSILSTLLILYIVTAVSCKKSDNETPVDPLYPTMLERLNSIDYQSKLTAFWQRNPYLQSDLNNFGFCAETTNFRELDPPAYKEITPSEAKAIARNFIQKNPQETGITDTTGVVLTVTNQFASGGGYFVSNVRTNEQTLDTLKIKYTNVSMRIENDQVVECVNNWFPHVYLPAEPFITTEKGIANLKGQEYSLPTTGGSVTGTVIEADLEGAQLSTMIIQYPNPASSNTTQKLELRIVYRIYLPAVWNVFYVDVMTGKTLITESTIIS